jgi:hypothetical protein
MAPKPRAVVPTAHHRTAPKRPLTLTKEALDEASLHSSFLRRQLHNPPIHSPFAPQPRALCIGERQVVRLGNVPLSKTRDDFRVASTDVSRDTYAQYQARPGKKFLWGAFLAHSKAGLAAAPVAECKV